MAVISKTMVRAVLFLPKNPNIRPDAFKQTGSVAPLSLSPFHSTNGPVTVRKDATGQCTDVRPAPVQEIPMAQHVLCWTVKQSPVGPPLLDHVHQITEKHNIGATLDRLTYCMDELCGGLDVLEGHYADTERKQCNGVKRMLLYRTRWLTPLGLALPPPYGGSIAPPHRNCKTQANGWHIDY